MRVAEKKKTEYLTWATRKQQNKSKKVTEIGLLRNEDNLKAIFTILFPVSVNANEIGKNQK